MPDFCAASGCSNERSVQTRTRGITFHKFPKSRERRRQWELALQRDGFVGNDRSLLCSEHFHNEDFDRTGQTVRLKAGAVPQVFNFPAHLQRPVTTRGTTASRRAEKNLPKDLLQNEPPPDDPVGTRNTRTSRKAGESLPLDLSQRVPKSQPPPNDDHPYALPDSPSHLKARLSEALARVESLERERLNSKVRERRAKKTIKSLLEDLKTMNIINEELKDRLDFHSGLEIDLFLKRGHEYTQDQKEFAVTLYLHGPKAYRYLRDSLHLPLPHPHTLQRWMQSEDAKPGPNTAMMDVLQRRPEEDSGSEAPVMDSTEIQNHVQNNPCTQKMCVSERESEGE